MDSVAAGNTVTALLDKLGNRNGLPPDATDTFAFLLLDGLAMQEEALVSITHTHLHGIELVGESATNETRFQSTYLYWQGAFHQGIALLTLIRTNLPFTVFRTQHFVQSLLNAWW